MRRSRSSLAGFAAWAALLGLAFAAPAEAAAPTNGLVARYTFNGDAKDSSGRGHHGVLHNVTSTSNRFRNGSSAWSFNGTNAYIEVPDHDDFSVTTTRQLSISVWMRPGTTKFPSVEGTRYVHWLGKGAAGQREWACRMYSSDNTEDRGNRSSFYLFNPSGGEGAGSYAEDKVTVGTWYHHVAVVDTRTDRIKWYKNGVLRDQDPFKDSMYHIMPQNGASPVRIGTRDFASYFKGAIDNLYIYNRALSPAEVVQLYNDTTP
jgi:hypothetical protein